MAPHAPYTVGDATFRRIATLAEELDLPVHVHVHETDGEIAESLAQHGRRPLERLESLGLLTERLIAVHAVHLTASEIAALARAGASVAHCPSSNLKLASGFAPVAALLASGHQRRPRHRWRGEQQPPRHVPGDAHGGAARERRWPATPRSCRRTRRCGWRRSAARAPSVWTPASARSCRASGPTLLRSTLGAPETQPCYDPVSHLVYACGREHVTDVWVAGQRSSRAAR